MLNVSENEYILDYKNKYLNYSVILKKPIKPQDSVRIRICYITDQIITSNFDDYSAPISIWLIDTNRNVWVQSLFAPEKRLENSSRSNMKTYRKCTDVTTAIECFDDPSLW